MRRSRTNKCSNIDVSKKGAVEKKLYIRGGSCGFSN